MHQKLKALATRFGARLVIGCILLWTQASNYAHAGGVIGTSMNDASLSEYDGVHLIARVHTTRAFVDHEKWGFFRLGLLPVPVIEGVQVQILSAGCLTNVLSDLNSWNPSSGGLRRLELRNIEISLLGEKEPRLHATIARVSRSGSLELSNVSVARDGGGPVSIPKAALQISGPASGCLRWNDSGKEVELFVFKLLETQKS
jgi:hypothetical protein